MNFWGSFCAFLQKTDVVCHKRQNGISPGRHDKKGLEISAGSKRLFGDDGKKDKVFVSSVADAVRCTLGAVVADSGNKVLRIPVANGGPASGKDVIDF